MSKIYIQQSFYLPDLDSLAAQPNVEPGFVAWIVGVDGAYIAVVSGEFGEADGIHIINGQNGVDWIDDYVQVIRIDGYELGLIYNPLYYNKPVHNVLGEHIASIDRKLGSISGGSGAQGMQGWQGSQGSGGSGAQGMQGWQGNQGAGNAGPQGFQGVSGGGGGGTTAADRLIATDSHTILRYSLDEGSAPCANTGTGGSLNLSVPAIRWYDPYLPNPFTFGRGVFGSGISTKCVNASVDPALITANTTIGESAEISISLWAKWDGEQQGMILFGKLYHSATLTAPEISFGITTDSFGSLQVVGAFGGSPAVVNSRPPQLGIPTLVSATYSTSTHLHIYINGELYTSYDSTSIAIDWGEHGAWVLSGSAWGAPAGSGGGFGGLIDEIRVEDVVRSQEYFREMYAQGVGLFL